MTSYLIRGNEVIFKNGNSGCTSIVKLKHENPNKELVFDSDVIFNKTIKIGKYEISVNDKNKPSLGKKKKKETSDSNEDLIITKNGSIVFNITEQEKQLITNTNKINEQEQHIKQLNDKLLSSIELINALQTKIELLEKKVFRKSPKV